MATREETFFISSTSIQIRKCLCSGRYLREEQESLGLSFYSGKLMLLIFVRILLWIWIWIITINWYVTLFFLNTDLLRLLFSIVYGLVLDVDSVFNYMES